ncbi:exportin-2 [Arabidopsis lyrata subsp. lyrata]|uniref:exportin-2 n=1 Tax=Arabidopsis lyrata subsp. lyrata TaxID=81972 RepID=UPI000A29D5C3|nr:exportin-2 [Arabidopsis lyrata subsp. lyrata]|eukprot:XP_020871098.1 exportin-2 [Arabidopsis lyrata subsp. lyrata]
MVSFSIVWKRNLNSQRVELPRDALTEQQLCQIKDGIKDATIFRRLKDLSFKYTIPVSEMNYMRDVMMFDHSLLEEKGTVKKLIHGIVIETVRVGSNDEDLFKRDFREYMAGESKRREVALSLFRSMVMVSQKVRALSRSAVYKLINKSAKKLRVKDCWSSWKWRDQDCGFRLATCLVESDDSFDVESVLQEYTTPILMLVDINKAPMVRATVLKLLLVAVRSGKASVSLGLLSLVGSNIGARSNVVHSLAADCIIEIMFVMNLKAGEVDVLPLMVNLFKALKLPGSEENEYLMKCIFQAVSVSEISPKGCDLCFRELIHILVCQRCQNPEFQKNLVQSLALLIERESHDFTENRLVDILGRCEEMVSSPIDDEHGFFLLKSVVDNLVYEVIASHMKHVWVVLFARLVNNETAQFQQSLVRFMSFFLVRHGIASLVDSVNSVHPDIFNAFVRDCWVPHMKLINEVNEDEKKTE